MKALTLTQPYASLIAIGAKRIETRSWSTHYRGPLAIHAGKRLGPVGGEAGLHNLLELEPFRRALEDHLLLLPIGAIVAICTLVDVLAIDKHTDWLDTFFLSDQERAFGDYSTGRYAWLLADVQPVDPPMPAMGKQGLWTFNQL